MIVLKQIALFVVVALTSVLLGYIHIPVEWTSREYGEIFEFGIRCLILVAFATYYRWFLESIGVARK